MKKGFVLSLAVIFGFTLVMGCATMRTKDAKGKEASEMVEELEMTLKIRINEVTGEIAITDEKGEPLGEKIQLEELAKIYNSPNGVKHVSTILYFHRSPGCFVATLNGTPIKFPRGCSD